MMTMPSPRKRERRGSQTRKGSQRRLVASHGLEDQGEEGEQQHHHHHHHESIHMRRRASLQRLALSSDDDNNEEAEVEEEEKSSTGTPDLSTTTPRHKHTEPVVLSAELVYVEPVEVITIPKKQQQQQVAKRRRSKSRVVVQEEEEKTAAALEFQLELSKTNSESMSKGQPNRPKYPRSFLGMVVRIVKILHALLNIIVIRGSVLTRRNLNGKLDEYYSLSQHQQVPHQQQQQEYEMIALYQEHISHHLFVYHLCWGRLLICLIVLMWGTCTTRLPRPIAIYIGMAMHWMDSLRALETSRWMPSDATSTTATPEDKNSNSNSNNNNNSNSNDPYRSSTAEEEVQTAMAWLHLFWFLVDGLYGRQILQKRKYEEQRIQRELYLSLIQEEEEEEEEVEYTTSSHNGRKRHRPSKRD